MDNGNIPFGYCDPKNQNDIMKFGGSANHVNESDAKWRDQFNSFPGTPEEAEAMKYKLSQEGKALNHDSIL